VLDEFRNELQQEELGMAEGEDRTSELVALVESIQQRSITVNQIDLLIEVSLVQLLNGNALALPLALEG
jgi:hypothetical protein